MKKIYIILPFILAGYCSHSQDSTKSWQFSAGVNLTSVPAYSFSRTDTSIVNALSVAPYLDIRNKNGFGLLYEPFFAVGGQGSGIYMHDITVGVEQYEKPLFDYFADYSHFFFTGNNNIPYTPITNELYAGIKYKKPWLSPLLNVGFGFGTDKENNSKNAYDFSLATGISHTFQHEWKNGDEGTLIPSLVLNAGTNQYFSFMRSTKYLSRNKKFANYVKKKKPGQNLPSQKTNESFSLSNVEMALEGGYECGQFGFRPAASLIFPVSSSGGKNVSATWQMSFSYSF